MRRILIIGGGPAQATIIEASVGAGLYTIVADDRPEQSGCLLSNELLVAHRYDAIAILNAALSLNLDAVVSGGADKTVIIAARVAEMLALPTYVSSKAAELSTRKGDLRRLYGEWGVAVPDSIEVGSMGEVEQAANRMGYPLVVKPVDGIGQSGVNRVNSQSTLSEAFDQAQTMSSNGRIVVETFLAGTEIGVNAYVFEGSLAILTMGERVAQQGAGKAFGVAFRKQIPADVSDKNAELIRHQLQIVAKKLGLENGPIYAQIMITPRGPFIIEAMPRLGGGEDARLVKAITGFDMARAVINEAIGESNLCPTERAGSNDGCGVLEFFTASPGRIVTISGLRSALACPGVIGGGFYVSAGHEVRECSPSAPLSQI
jgi:biotin carboxylase